MFVRMILACANQHCPTSPPKLTRLLACLRRQEHPTKQSSQHHQCCGQLRQNSRQDTSASRPPQYLGIYPDMFKVQVYISTILPYCF